MRGGSARRHSRSAVQIQASQRTVVALRGWDMTEALEQPCIGRAGYRDRGAAEARIRGMRQIEPVGEAPRLEAYRCGECHKWHIRVVGQRQALRRRT